MIYGDNLTCSAGDIVSFSVYIKDNPGLTAFAVGIACDSDWIYFDEEPIQGDFTNEGSMIASSDARQINVVWYNVDEVGGDGKLFSVNAHISPSTPVGEYPIQVAYSMENTIDQDCNAVELETVNGCISVKPSEKAERSESPTQQIPPVSREKTEINTMPVKLALIAVTAIILGIPTISLLKSEKNKRKNKKRRGKKGKK